MGFSVYFPRRYKDGQPYPWPTTLSQLILYPESANQSIYTTSVSQDDAGNYTCVLKNDTVVFLHTIHLTVYGKLHMQCARFFFLSVSHQHRSYMQCKSLGGYKMQINSTHVFAENLLYVYETFIFLHGRGPISVSKHINQSKNFFTLLLSDFFVRLQIFCTSYKTYLYNNNNFNSAFSPLPPCNSY